MWYNDASLLRNFADALSNAGVLEDSDDFSAFMRKPQRYNDEYEAWKEAEYPSDDSDDGWDDFVDAISVDDEDDDDDE